MYPAMERAIKTCGNAGRGAGESALTASREIYKARKLLTEFFGGTDPADIWKKQ